MLYKKEDEFAKVFKEESPHGLYLFYGNEEYLVDAWRVRIEGRFQGKGDFNLLRQNGRSLDMDMLLEAVETLPMLMNNDKGGGKCVVVSDLDPGKLSANDMAALESLLPDLPPDCTLVITGKSAFDLKNANAKKIIKLAQTHGSAVELSVRGQAGLVSFLKSRAKGNGSVLSTNLANMIISRCGTDMNMLNREIDKICAYAGYSEIGESHIMAVATPLTEVKVFDLGKAILSGRAQTAMEILDDLFYLREQPIAILGALVMPYVDMYRARVARDKGIGQAEVVEKFGYKGREFRVRNAFQTRLSTKTLRECLYALYECDTKMKSTGIDSKVLLEQTVVRLLMLGSS